MIAAVCAYKPSEQDLMQITMCMSGFKIEFQLIKIPEDNLKLHLLEHPIVISFGITAEHLVRSTFGMLKKTDSLLFALPHPRRIQKEFGDKEARLITGQELKKAQVALKESKNTISVDVTNIPDIPITQASELDSRVVLSTPAGETLTIANPPEDNNSLSPAELLSIVAAKELLNLSSIRIVRKE
jgi:hypothetical protein